MNNHVTKKNSPKKSKPEQLPNLPLVDEFKKKYQHDAFCKNVLGNAQRSRNFLRYIFNPELINVLDLDKLKSTREFFVNDELKRSIADLVYRVPLKDRCKNASALILIELKTDNDKWTVFQLAEYVFNICKRELNKIEAAATAENAEEETKLMFAEFLLPAIIPVIVYHGGGRFTSAIELSNLFHKLLGTKLLGINMEALLLDVSEIDLDNLPEDMLLATFLMALRAVYEKDIVSWLIKIYKKLEPTLHIKASQQMWQKILHYMMTSAKYFQPEDYKKLLKKIPKKGNVKMTISLIDRMVGEGIEKGKVEGKAEGKAEMVIRILSHRLAVPPKSLQKQINSIQNIAKLDELGDFALTCVSLGEFATA
ncbi:MAG: Rpn family recombination-promoting nuclease/putative transposase, partial [Planctomycetaceae bacterium]|nr:Rpn family recombination-promoting nuclease/putative transposase [Planctomycetaceae bacterium]